MKKILLLLIIFILVGCSNDISTFQKINGNEAKQLVSDSGAIIIDVRSSAEYERYHISNAINIPVDKISKEELASEIESFDSNIIVYCASGYRSNEAAQKLVDLGYNNIYDLGSIDNWGEDSEQ